MPADEKKYAFAQAVVVLFSPHLQMRSILRTAVISLGFKNVFDFGDVDQARLAVIERMPDLVMFDLDTEPAKICALAREIRESNVCHDPFVPIFVLSWQPNLGMVNSIMEAGVDDVVVLPISMKTIYERIDALIRNRPEFVVTANYIGPERRSAGRERHDALGLGTIKVPNSLRYKTLGDQAAIASPESIREFRARVEHHRVNRYAQRIQWLIDQILSDKTAGKETQAETMQRHDEIGRLIESTAFDLRTHGHAELLEITDSMVRLLEFARARHGAQFYDFLRLHAMSINATLLEREGAAALVTQALTETASYLDKVEAL